jgi:hypothetical protein
LPGIGAAEADEGGGADVAAAVEALDGEDESR